MPGVFDSPPTPTCERPLRFGAGAHIYIAGALPSCSGGLVRVVAFHTPRGILVRRARASRVASRHPSRPSGSGEAAAGRGGRGAPLSPPHPSPLRRAPRVRLSCPRGVKSQWRPPARRAASAISRARSAAVRRRERDRAGASVVVAVAGGVDAVERCAAREATTGGVDRSTNAPTVGWVHTRPPERCPLRRAHPPPGGVKEHWLQTARRNAALERQGEKNDALERQGEKNAALERQGEKNAALERQGETERARTTMSNLACLHEMGRIA